MSFAKPFVLHGAHKQRREALDAAAETYRMRIVVTDNGQIAGELFVLAGQSEGLLW